MLWIKHVCSLLQDRWSEKQLHYLECGMEFFFGARYFAGHS